MKLVIMESPYAGDVELNKAFARACMKDCLDRGEAPMVSHLLYTQVLSDDSPAERQQGIDAGLAWRHVAEKSVVYTDFGISVGMQFGIDLARDSEIPVEYRTLGLATWEKYLKDNKHGN